MESKAFRPEDAKQIRFIYSLNIIPLQSKEFLIETLINALRTSCRMKYPTVDGKTVIGLIEPIVLLGKNGVKKDIFAKIDTGASKSSLDSSLTFELHLGPIITSRIVKSAHGNRVRPILEAELVLASKRIKAEFTIADRAHMAYPVLIGQNILKQGFMIDPSKGKPQGGA